jgi:hypothetical protein
MERSGIGGEPRMSLRSCGLPQAQKNDEPTHVPQVSTALANSL